MSGAELYRALLVLFPPGFRRDEADDAARTFDALLRAAPGPWARARVWVRCVAAVPGAAAAEWWQVVRSARGTHLRNPHDGSGIMGGMWRQGWLTVRALRRAPGFTASTVLLMGLGVGAVTTVFTLVDHVLLRPLPYTAPDRLVLIENGNHSGPLFERMTVMRTVERWAASLGQTTTLLGEGEPVRLRTARVSEDFFRVFDGRAARGRLLTAADFTDPDASVVVDHGTWQRIWGGDPELVGRTIRLDGRAVTVIGVTAPEFVAPEAVVGRDVAFWRPVDASSELMTTHTAWVLSVAGRLAAGASVDAAREEMEAVMAGMAQVHENYRDRDDAPRELPVTPLGEATVRGVRAGLGLLLGAVAMLLLVACANVAQLFLARGLGRSRAMAVRRALGAGTGVLVGQLLVETLAVGLAGGALGVGIGWLGLQGFLALTPDILPGQAAITIDLRVIAVVVGVAVLTAVVFGLLPAVRSVRRDLADTLRGADRSATPGRGVGALRRALIVGEVALSLVLVAGAGLLLRSFLLVHAQDPGIRVADVWTVPLSLTSGVEAETWVGTMAEIGEAVAAVPGAESVAWGLTMPLTSGGSRCCWRSPVTAEGDATGTPMIHPVSVGYFQTLGIPLQGGRVWTDGEARADPTPVIVSEGLATELWGGSVAALNRPLEMERLSMIVVGVAQDTRHYGLENPPDPALYVPAERLPFPMDRAHLAVLMRPGSAGSVGRDLRAAVWSATPDVPIPVVRSMDEWLSAGTSSRRFDSVLFATFGALALVLAAAGLYGTLVHLAGQRRRELGIRMALGASRARIERELVTGGLGMALAGVIVGLGGAWALGRYLESRLWGVSATDLPTLAIVSGLLLSTAALACWLPARRAGRTDPVKTLRVE